MTNEEKLAQLRHMTKAEIMKKFWPMAASGKIKPEVYGWMISQGQLTGHSQQSNDQVRRLIQQFGGREVE